MDYTQLLQPFFNVLWYLVPLAILTVVVKSGEAIVNLPVKLFPDKSRYHLIKNILPRTKIRTLFLLRLNMKAQRLLASARSGEFMSRVFVFSICTVMAKELLRALCSELLKATQQSRNHGGPKTMYCNASMLFKPPVASVGAALEKARLESARQACSKDAVPFK